MLVCEALKLFCFELNSHHLIYKWVITRIYIKLGCLVFHEMFECVGMYNS